jgi:hypothetical protein
VDDATANHGANTAPNPNAANDARAVPDDIADRHGHVDSGPGHHTDPDDNANARTHGHVLVPGHPDIPGHPNGDGDRFGAAADRLPPHPRFVPATPHRPSMATVEVV